MSLRTQTRSSCRLKVCGVAGILLTNAILGALLSPSLFAGDNWPQFRGPKGDGHSDSVGLPLEWSETTRVRWKTAIPGEGWSSPVVWGSQVWLTTALEGGKSLHVICVDRESGKILHDLELFKVDKVAPKHNVNSYASPTPVIEANRVYVHFGTYGTACLDTSNGQVVWKKEDLKLDHQVGPGSSPLLHGDLLILNCDGYDTRFVIALNKLTGAVVWRTDRPGPLNKEGSINKAFSTPLVIDVAGKLQAVSPGAQRVVAYDPLSGEELWKVTYPGFSNVPRPVYGHGLVFVCTGYMKPEIWAIKPEGTGDITSTHVAWKFTKQVPAKPSPLLVGKHLFLIHDSGIATCLDPLTGKEVWTERLGGSYSASPVFVDGRMYLFSEEGKTLVLQPGAEYKLLATSQLDGRFMASPAITGKAFILRTHTHLYRVEQ